MSQPEYIIQSHYWRDTGRRFEQAESLRAFYPERTRVTGRVKLGGVTMQHSEGTGKHDRSRLRIIGKRRSGDAATTYVQNTAAGLKVNVRRLRASEAVILDGLDAEIDALTLALEAKREERRRALADAFRRGNVVRLNELSPEPGRGY